MATQRPRDQSGKIISTQRLDKHNANRLSNEKNLTPKQIVSKIHREIRGNSQPPSTQDYTVGLTNYEAKNGSVKESLEMQMQRQMLIQQYTQNYPRNVSAFQQQVKIPIEARSVQNNFQMNQTTHEFSPIKQQNKHNSHRKQVIMSPILQQEPSYGYYQSNDILDDDNGQNYRSHDITGQIRQDEYDELENLSKMSKGRTRTILTSLGVEQQPVQISNKIQENANKNYINENLYQAQLNGQIKVQHEIQAYRNQNQHYTSAKDSKKQQQNFFQSKTNPQSNNQSDLKSPVNTSFLPSIDNSYRLSGKMPPEVQIPQIYPGTPGKSNQKNLKEFNLKIGDATAEVKITIMNSQTPRPQKQTMEKVKKSKKESSSQHSRQKTVIDQRSKPVVIQKIQTDPLRANKDRQLEDLNETLQRLAREKQNAINGRINITTSRRKPNKIELIQDPRTPGYHLEVTDPNFLNDNDSVQDSINRRRKKQQDQELQNFKYKLETNNKVQPGGRLIMGDNMLTSQRLQGIKQVIPNTVKQSDKGSKVQSTPVQSPPPPLQYQNIKVSQNHKVYKINKADVQLESHKQTPQKYIPYDNEENMSQNFKQLKQGGIRNIIVESQIPTFGPDLYEELRSKESSPLLYSPAEELEYKFNKHRVDNSSNSQPKKVLENNHKMDTLKIGCRFSSVIEDVEKEQMTSPSPLLKQKNKDSLNVIINANLKTEERIRSPNDFKEMRLNSKDKLIQQTDPDLETLSRNDINDDSREDLMEISRQNMKAIEVTSFTPENKKRILKKKENNGETTYSQIFNLQTNNILEHEEIKPTETIDKKTLANALKPPTQNKDHSSRYNNTSTIQRKRKSNTELDMNQQIVKQRNNKNIINMQSNDVSVRDNSIGSKDSYQDQAKLKLINNQNRTQKIQTPRGKMTVSLGDNLKNDHKQSISPNQTKETPKNSEIKQEEQSNKKVVTKMASQTVDLRNNQIQNADNCQLPVIEQRLNSKSPIRVQAPKPPLANKNDRIEGLNLTRTKFTSINKNSKDKRKQDYTKKTMKTQFEPIIQKIDTNHGDSSSECNEQIKSLDIGKQFKIKRDNYSYCTDYCQYRGQQLPKKYKTIYTNNKYRKTEGSYVCSQRLFMSKECAESEDRRMMPILVLNLDGAVGYWDDYKKYHYVLRPKILDSLIQLSYDFRLVAVSSQSQKLIFRVIYGFMNVSEDQSTKHLYFDAVYQLGSSTGEKNEMCTIKNIEEVQYDLTQVLLDMQFKRQVQKKLTNIDNEDDFSSLKMNNQFLTFWEQPLYRPHNKMLIFTTERYLNKNHCYSFDYNYLYQSTKFKNEKQKKSPIVLQLPHLRLNLKISFEIVHQMIFTMQNITQAISLEKQDRSKIVDGKYYENPEISSFQVCKKFMSFKWKVQENKMRNNGSIKGLRVFDSNNDPYVILGNINFNDSYKFIKKYFNNRKSNWLKIRKYYLLTKPTKQEKIHKMKLMAKVTFNDSPEIIRIGEENGSQKIAIGTTHDSSKAESIKAHSKANQYMSDDAKNLYNGLMIRNFKMQQEINSYARHHRILFQHKMAKKKQEESKIEAALRPIVIFDGEEEDKPSSQLRQYGKLKSSINHDPKEKIAEQMNLLKQEKQYAFKYRTLLIRSNETYEQWQTPDCELTKFTVIDLKVKVSQESFEKKGAAQEQQQTGRGGADKGENSHKSCLIDYLSKRQGRIAFQTSQESHLKNNLSQLVDGKQQYVDQQKELQEQDKEQLPSINDKETNNNLHQNYLDLI